jgi:hypothetical protein
MESCEGDISEGGGLGDIVERGQPLSGAAGPVLGPCGVSAQLRQGRPQGRPWVSSVPPETVPLGTRGLSALIFRRRTWDFGCRMGGSAIINPQCTERVGWQCCVHGPNFGSIAWLKAKAREEAMLWSDVAV